MRCSERCIEDCAVPLIACTNCWKETYRSFSRDGLARSRRPGALTRSERRPYPALRLPARFFAKLVIVFLHVHPSASEGNTFEAKAESLFRAIFSAEFDGPA